MVSIKLNISLATYTKRMFLKKTLEPKSLAMFRPAPCRVACCHHERKTVEHFGWKCYINAAICCLTFCSRTTHPVFLEKLFMLAMKCGSSNVVNALLPQQTHTDTSPLHRYYRRNYRKLYWKLYALFYPLIIHCFLYVYIICISRLSTLKDCDLSSLIIQMPQFETTIMMMVILQIKTEMNSVHMKTASFKSLWPFHFRTVSLITEPSSSTTPSATGPSNRLVSCPKLFAAADSSHGFTLSSGYEYIRGAAYQCFLLARVSQF